MGYNGFQIVCVFAEYDLFKPTTSIQHFIYIDFRIILTQFYVNLSRQKHQIDVYMYRLAPEILRFHPIPPFIFPLQSTVPLILYPLSFFLYSPFNPIPPFIFPLQPL